MAAALSAELEGLSQRLVALETDRANKERRDQENVTEKARQCTGALIDLAKLVVAWKEPLRGEDDTDQTISESNRGLLLAVARVEQSLVGLSDNMTKRLEDNMQSSLRFADTYASEVVGLQNRLQEAQQDVEKRMRDAQDSIDSLEKSIETATVAQKGMKGDLSACEKRGEMVQKSNEFTGGDTAAVVAATGGGAALWFGAIVFPPLAIGAIACNLVQAGYIADDVIKTRKIKKIKEEVEAIKTKISSSNSRISGLKSQVHDMENTRANLLILKAAVERTSKRSNAISEKAQTLERRYNQDQSRVAECLIKLRTARLTSLDFAVADSKDAVLETLVTLSLDMTAFIPNEHMVTEFLQDLLAQLRRDHGSATGITGTNAVSKSPN
ncbi:uncharacterized protein BDZ99DRAFT_466177 [Mytilinidion resinicola]|uniref:Uncharacterized protein n=1 Tax=Mytilinidion resinicola TaxID=574789 RepID=A0A6A6YCJ8_9PEZI|nr:uncharacterized protein BDZ99DRAFT_466177 [Mytilinidion resinicola]KAF2805825.1 hypothetical protein BDZ99DRAFT_466177 [Mytilinidion resinicola]